MPVRWRSSVRIIGYVGLVTFCLLLLRPLVGAQVITSAVEQQAVQVRVVSTGLLPIRTIASGGNSAELISGQTATLTAAQVADSHHTIRNSIHLSGYWWVAIGAIVLSPLLWCLTIGLPATKPHRSQRRSPVAALILSLKTTMNVVYTAGSKALHRPRPRMRGLGQQSVGASMRIAREGRALSDYLCRASS